MNLSAIVYLVILTLGIACTVWYGIRKGVFASWYHEMAGMWNGGQRIQMVAVGGAVLLIAALLAFGGK